MTGFSFKSITKPAVFVYPLAIIIVIPTLLVINTFLSLYYFNRDVNYLIRHQAISIAATIKPSILTAVTDAQDLSFVLRSAQTANDDIVSLSILERVSGQLRRIAQSSDKDDNQTELTDPLNQLALSLNQSFAGLVYDPHVGQNVWSVVVPLNLDKDNNYLLRVKLKTETVDSILTRTSRDSVIILFVTVLASLLLLTNHFIFYKKAEKAQQLAEVDKLKDEFISMASHELRTPVSALVGYLELFKKKLPEEAYRTVSHEYSALDGISHELQMLINDLLEVSRIEQGRLKVQLASTDVGSVIQHVVQTLTPLAAQKSLELHYTPQSLPTISTDPDRLRQILTNLISNAIKYTLHGHVEILATQEASMIKISVKDTGIGIPAEHMSKLYTKFFRVQDAKTQEVTGTGLGLWITKQFVEALGGSMYVESLYGTGSVFTFTLPLH